MRADEKLVRFAHEKLADSGTGRELLTRQSMRIMYIMSDGGGVCGCLTAEDAASHLDAEGNRTDDQVAVSTSDPTAAECQAHSSD